MLQQDESEIGVVTLKGRLPGATVVVMAGVHGDEPCGVKALDRVLPRLTDNILRGTVHIVQRANPEAVKVKQRQTEMNLNRAFLPECKLDWRQWQTYEFRRARELMPVLESCDALLDLHSYDNPKGIPFIICEPKSIEVAKRLPFDLWSNGWDEIEAGGTDYFVNKSGGMGICVECGQDRSRAAVDKAEESIWAFLLIMGSIDGEIPSTQEQRQVHAYYIHKTKVDFKPARKFRDFEVLAEGELIGTDGEEEILAPAGVCILFVKEREEKGKEAFILGHEL